MDPVTAIGMIAVVVMFCTGLALVWTGLRRRPDRLPEGADAVLAAVAEGRIARPDHVIDLVKPPAERPRRDDLPPSVRLLPREAEPLPAARVPADTTAPRPRPTDEVSASATSEPRSGDLSSTIFERVDDPHGDEFFATEAELQRF